MRNIVIGSQFKEQFTIGQISNIIFDACKGNENWTARDVGEFTVVFDYITEDFCYANVFTKDKIKPIAGAVVDVDDQ